MRILVVNCAYDAGLTAPADLLNRYATLTGWSEALLAQGASAVSVLQLFGSDARVHQKGVEYFFCRDTAGGRLWRSQGVAAAQHPDIVHFNGLIFPWQTWRLRRALPERTAIVLQDHGGAEPARHRLRRLHHRIGLGVADAFLFSARDLAIPWQNAHLIAPRQDVYAVMESSTTMRPLTWDEARMKSGVIGSPSVLWVGRLNANKDPLSVLDGFERTLTHLPEAHLTMVYNSEDWLPQVQARIARSESLSARVHLRGHIAHGQLAAFYSAADLFVLGSHHEGSGYALIEALACGAVPVVTGIPSFRVLTGDGAVGALWPAGDAVAFADALIRCGARDLAASRAGVLEHFENVLSWPAIGRQALSIYADVLARRGATKV
jgi:glycosyltransferase involved in cell wall biosynthesis